MKILDWIALSLLSIAGTLLLTVSYLLGEAHGKYGERILFAQHLIEQSKTPKLTEPELRGLCESYYFRNPNPLELPK
jgi:hypothetical protein